MFNLTPTVRALLLANVAIYFLQDRLPLGALTLYAFQSPNFQPWQLLTYQFLHGSIGHLFSNMLSLFFFGAALESRWGTGRFLVFYLVCGIGAGLIYNGIRAYELHQIAAAAQAFVEHPTALGFDRFTDAYGGAYEGFDVLTRSLKSSPGNPELVRSATQIIETIYQSVRDSPMLGASGAVFGILFAFGYLFPNTLLYFYFLFPIKAKYFVFLYGAYELYAGVHRTAGDNVAHFAHLGGMIFAFALLKYWERTRPDFY